MELNGENRKQFLRHKVYVLKFSAVWCGPCKMLAPIFDRVAANTEVPCASVDVDETATKDLVEKYQVRTVPTLIKVQGGVEVGRRQGFINETALTEFIG